jgi:uncharacterized integral membrane protein
MTIIQQAQQFILNWYNQKNYDNRLIYHNYALMDAIVKKINALAEVSKVSEEDKEIAVLAGYFSQIRPPYLTSENQQYPTQLAKQFFQQINCPLQVEVLRTLEHWERKMVKTIPDALLNDATNAVEFGEKYSDWTILHKLECELFTGVKIKAKRWNAEQIEELLNIRFYTPYAKLHYPPIVAQNIIKVKTKLEKNANEASPKSKNGDERGAQTFFRANYRNHINLSAIADNKANIMISVNAILISILITILTWRNMTEVNPKIIFPAVIFLITGLASLIFAILSARPKITNVNKGLEDLEKIKQNIMFFGSFTSIALEKYEKAVEEVLNNEKLLYGNMSRDLYFLGKVLAKKYYYLTISYTIFMVGFITSVILFLIFLLIP